MRAPRRTRVLVGEKGDAATARAREDPVERLRLVGAGREVGVAVLDRHLVPRADPDRVRVGEVHAPVARELDQRVRIIHDRRAPLGARDVVVLEAEGVPHLVRRELAEAGKCHRLGGLGRLVTGLVGLEQPLRDQEVLPGAEGAERHLALDDFVGARVGDDVAVAPPPGVAVHPLDHVVAHVHRVGALGEELDPEGVPEAGRLERLVPPAGPLEDRGANRLRRAAVHVVHDRPDRLAHRRTRVLLLQPVPHDELPDQRRPELRGVVGVPDREEPPARVEGAGPVAGLGQRDERVPLPEGERVG